MFAASETLVSDVNSRRGAKAGGGGPGAGRRRFTTATQYFRLKRRSQIFITR